MKEPIILEGTVGRGGVRGGNFPLGFPGQTRTWGITPGKRVVFYCGTGWRASEAFFYAYLMGWPRLAVYDGGWYEWSQDTSNPTAQGVPVQPIIRCGLGT